MAGELAQWVVRKFATKFAKKERRECCKGKKEKF